MFFFYIKDYSTEHLKTGLMILEAYVLIAPERVIPVSINLYKSNQIVMLITHLKKTILFFIFIFVFFSF